MQTEISRLLASRPDFAMAALIDRRNILAKI
jgi:hypothetical protein